MLASLSRPRRRLAIAVAALALGAAAGLLSFALLNRAPAVPPVAQGTLGPVLLVPGYGGSTEALDVLARALITQGRDAIVVQSAGDGTGDLAQQAEVLDREVTAALARTGAPTVDLVGYSAGGVIVRLWIEEFEAGASVRRVLTLGSPHHGTALAAFAGDLTPNACPLACVQLAGDSDLLRSLNADDETPGGPLWVSLWTENDRTVIPPDSASLEGALNFSVQSRCPSLVIEHADLPRTPTVMAMTIGLLGTNLPQLPGPEICTP